MRTATRGDLIIFSQPRRPDQQHVARAFELETGRVREKLARDKIIVDPDAGVHTLRHTFLSEV